jgi:1,4-dihydroxy-2-naphthoyl-CoA hydrolase
VAAIWFGGKRPAREGLEQTCAIAMHGHLGLEFVGCGDDWLAIRMPVDERTRQPAGRLHGGASVVLAETAASMAANFCVDTDKQVVVGMEINANHVRPVRDGWVIATARPEMIGRSSQIWSVRIEDEQGRLICISRFTGAVIPAERK